MKVEYSKRAIQDLQNLAAESKHEYGDAVVAEIERYFRKIIAQIGHEPQSRPPVFGRAGVHVAVLVYYPFKVFYRVFEDSVRILHVRHTARRRWERK
jgi:toxin ParE1/3/4